MMRRLTTRLLGPALAVSALTVSTLGCSKGVDPFGPNGQAVLNGTYTLSTVDGQPAPPFQFANGTRLVGYSLTVRSDATYHIVISTVVNNTPVDKVDDGTYTYDRATGAVLFTGPQLGLLHAQASNAAATLTLDKADSGGYVVVLTK